jgi:hypothetical protein
MTADSVPTLAPALAPADTIIDAIRPPSGGHPGANPDSNPGAQDAAQDAANPDTVRWMTIPDAAALVGVHPRTLRRWASNGRVVSRLEERDGHPTKLMRADTIPDVKVDTRDGSKDGARGDATVGAHVDNKDGAQDAVRDGAQVGTVQALSARLSDLQADNEFLRQQLRQRAVELERRDQAEAELRRLLLSSQQALQMALERPMLPPAPVALGPVKKARWWQLWR